ncbi:MAG TPA: hypothetical protein VNV65_01355 [Candidatus Solibacter sp.]|nr:hypothetical protein [Candidatus Solibacter sp.]
MTATPFYAAIVALPVLLAPLGAQAADSTSARYLAAVHQAQVICTAAAVHDNRAASEAARALKQGTGESQPEVLRDLQANPPDLADAAARLTAIERELGRPVAIGDGRAADAKLHAILQEARYRPAGVSPIDRAWEWFVSQLLQLLAWLLTGGGGGIAGVIELAVAAAVGILLAAFLARSVWSRRGETVAAAAIERARPRHARDWFAEADRRAAAADYPGALRALTSGVATAIGGEGAWETSPLTVRELFVSTARIDPLRPLLLPFEASAYGHRQPDAEVYAHAATVAAPYREEAPG